MKQSQWTIPTIIYLLAVCMGGHATASANPLQVPPPPPRVLVINSYHQGEVWSNNELRGIFDTFKEAYPDLVPGVEHLDTKRFADRDHLVFFSDYLQRKYRNKRFDLVMALDNAALSLIRDAGPTLFGSTPVVFAGVNGYTPEMLAGRRNITGVAEKQDIAATLQMALALHPNPRTVLAVHDYTDSGQAMHQKMAQVCSKLEQKVSIIYPPPGSIRDLVVQLEALPANALVILLTYVTDATGRTFTRLESTRIISSASPVPVYAMHETQLGHGIVGGMLLEGEHHGRQAATMALRILGGEPISDLPVTDSTSRPVFDYTQMKRFHIPLKQLPPNAMVIHRPVSFFKRYQSVLIPGSLVIGFLLLTLGILILSVIRIQKAKTKAQESESKFATLFRTTPTGIVITDAAKCRIIEMNKNFETISGYSRAETIGKTTVEIGLRSDLQNRASLIERLRNDKIVTNIDIEFRHKSGQMHQGLVSAALCTMQGKDRIICAMFDITELKQLEYALKDSEDHLQQRNQTLRAILDHTHIMAVYLDTHFNFMWVNQAYANTCQHPPAFFTGKNHFGLYPHPVNQAIFQRVVDSGKPFFAEAEPFEFPDQPERGVTYRDWSLIPVKDSGGDVVGLVFTLTEVTQKVKTQAELRFKSALVDQSQDSIICTDLDFKISFVNPATEKLFGYPAAQIMGHRPNMFNVEPEAEAIQHKIYTILAEGKEYTGVVRARNQNGRTFWCMATVAPLRDDQNQIIGYIGSQRDISDLVNANNALQQYRQVVESSPNLVAGVTPDYRYNFVNAAFLAYHQKEHNAVIGKTMAELIGQETFELIVEPRLKRSFAGESLRYEHAHCFAQKGTRHLLEAYYPLKNRDGAVTSVVIIINDLTELKEIEQEQERLKQQLNQLQKIEAIGALAGGIAHDFNNILYPILGYAELLQEDLPQDSPLQRSIHGILKGTKRARDLVKQILTFSRQAEKEIKPVRPHTIVQEVLQLIKATLPKSIEIKEQIDPNGKLIMADPTQIHQIVMNLATNAYHAMEQEGGTLTVEVSTKTIGLKETQYPDTPPGEYVLITVTDTGMGMDPETLNRIFDPYFTTKTQDKGTGLGLAVVHGIVKSYRGDIRIKSTPGKGSHFAVFLPTIETERKEEQKTPTATTAHGTERILLVDDEVQIMQLERSMLERLGYQVTAFTSSTEALQAFQNAPQSFDLVITDMSMPKMTGDHLAQEILKTQPKTPIIICTGFSETLTPEKAKRIGIRGFLMKPVLKSELTVLVRTLLDESLAKEAMFV